MGVDDFELDRKKYVVVVDYYSRYPEIAYFPSLITSTVMAKLKSIFARWGIPELMIHVHCFPRRNLNLLVKKYGFVHITPSAYFALANRVAIANRILKQEDPFLALLVHEATPIAATGVNLSLLIMGRQICTTIPILSCYLSPRWSDISFFSCGRCEDEEELQ